MAFRGSLDSVTHTRIHGWAWDGDTPDQPIGLVVSCDGQILARVLADRYRPDLETAGIGNGRHAFDIPLTVPLSSLVGHSVSVRREDDGRHVPKSPHVLGPAAAFDRSVQDAIARVLSTVAGEDDLHRRLAFLTDQADRLRQTYSDARSGAHERQARRRSRWSEPGIAGADAAPPASAPRALVIDDRLPLPDHDAGSNAILSHMRSLQRLGYAVTFAPANLRGDGAALEAEGITCCLHPWYVSIEEVLMRQRGAFALVYLHRVSTAARYMALARDHQPKARLVYSVADLHHLRLARQAEIEERPELRSLSERFRITELASAWQSDAIITHSTAEAAILGRPVRAQKIHVVPWSLNPRSTTVPFSERRGFAFVGGYGHSSNVDAAHWLVDAVMPEMEAAGGTLPCVLAGSNMPDGLRDLRRHDVDPIGHLPDLASLFDRVRLTVAPLAYGAGVKGKVIDSLAAGVPCVCTPAAAEGLDLPPLLRAQIGTTPAELAGLIRALHDDEGLNRACSEAGLAYIAEAHSEAQVDRMMRGAAGLTQAVGVSG